MSNKAAVSEPGSQRLGVAGEFGASRTEERAKPELTVDGDAQEAHFIDQAGLHASNCPTAAPLWLQSESHDCRRLGSSLVAMPPAGTEGGQPATNTPQPGH